MKNKMLSGAMILLLIFNLGSCGQHMHKFGEWTELSKSTCTEKGIMERICVCGEVEEKSIPLLPHNAQAASCTEASVCRDCGALTGPQLGHSIVAATCTTPAYCSECRLEFSSAIGHQIIKATCTAAEYCRICLERFGEPLAHHMQEASCTAPEGCIWCDYAIADALGHDWLAASCTEPKTCARCYTTDGEPIGHAWNNRGTECLACGAARINDTLGLFMSGDVENSDSARVPFDKSATSKIKVISDGIVSVEAMFDSKSKTRWTVDDHVNVNLEEYPVVFILTRDLCTCESENGRCYALESCNINVIAGDVSIPIPKYEISEAFMIFDPIIRDGHLFLYFYNDYSQNNPGEQKGRIGGLDFSVNNGLVPSEGKIPPDEESTYDICFVAFFKTLQDAKLYMGEYLEQLYPTENATIGKDIVYTETDLQTEDAEDTEIEIEIEEETEVETLG